MNLRMLFLVVLVLSAGMLGGCLRVETVVRVNADGSGTIHETFMLSRELSIMMRAFESMGDDPEKKSGLFNERKLKEEAATMGEGVRYVSGKAITSKEGDGYEATYAFNDISKLRVKQNPGGKLSGMDVGGRSSSSTEKEDVIRFAFTRGTPATLVIYMPAQEKPKPRKPQREREEVDTDDTNLGMARMMLGDLRISTVVEVAGSIVETNASFRKGSSVTLMEIDFDQLLEDESALRQVREYEYLSKEEARALMQKYPGLRVELNDVVRVKFRR